MTTNQREVKGGWFHTIPSHWQALKIRRICQVKRGASPRPIDDPQYFDDLGTHGWVRISDVTASERNLLTTEQRLSDLGKSLSVEIKPGELFLSIAGSVGKPMIAGIPCCIHDGFVYFDRLKALPDFLYYIFLSGRSYEGLGKLGTQLNLNTDTVADINVPLPPLTEQTQIVNFLDAETKKVDGLVEKKKRLIDLLDEKNAARVSEAVTHGLTRSAATNDSGVPWIGKCPKSWAITRLAQLTESIQTGPFGSQVHADEYVVGGIPLINPSDLIDGGIQVAGAATVADSTARRLHRHRLQRGDLVLARRGEMGRRGLVTAREEGALCGTGSLRVRCRVSELQPEYLNHVIGHNGCREQLELSSVGATMDNLNTSIISRLAVPVPPIHEQGEIIEYCNRYARDRALQQKVSAAISLLREYRAALITAAVTGQLDLRKHEKQMEALA